MPATRPGSLRILLFSSLIFKTPTKKTIFSPKFFSAFYCTVLWILKGTLHFHHFFKDKIVGSFSCYFCLMIEGSGSRRSKNIRGSATLEERISGVKASLFCLISYQSFLCDLHRLSVSTDNPSCDSQWARWYQYHLYMWLCNYRYLLILDICRACVCFGQIFVTHLFCRPLQYKHWDVFWPWHPLIGEGQRVPLGMFC